MPMFHPHGRYQFVWLIGLLMTKDMAPCACHFIWEDIYPGRHHSSLRGARPASYISMAGLNQEKTIGVAEPWETEGQGSF